MTKKAKGGAQNATRRPSQPAGTMNVNVGGNRSENNVVNVNGGLRIGQFKLQWPFKHKTDTPPARTLSAQSEKMFETLRTRFTLEEIDNICYEIGIAPDELSARTRSGKARQVVEAAAAHRALGKLERIIKRERPE